MHNRREKRTSSLCRILMCLIVLSLALHTKAQSTTWDDIDYNNEPWVKNASQPYTIHKGLQGRHLAIWASHGIFYDINRQRWRWQRPPLFTTCEDLFTQTIVVPYLMPLPVTFSWRKNIGSSLFQHRHQIGYDNGLCKQVFAGGEQWWTLPAPTLSVDIVKNSV